MTAHTEIGAGADPGPQRVALLTIPCLSSTAVIINFLERHRERFVLVATSARLGTHPGRTAIQSINHIRRSGLRFALYLGADFMLFPMLCRCRDMLSRLWSRPRPVSRSLERRCRELGIAHERVPDVNAQPFHQLLHDLEVDLIVVCYFDQILDAPVIEIPCRGVVNVHPGRLPERRGLFPELHALADGDSCLGVTVHRIVDRGIDSGPVLAQHTLMPGSGSLLRTTQQLLQAGMVLLERAAFRPGGPAPGCAQRSTGGYRSYPTRIQIDALAERGVPMLRWRDLRS